MRQYLMPDTNVAKLTVSTIAAHSTALIAQDCDIRGTVSFGPGCVIHPRATIHVLSPTGEIKFGKDCVVEEGARIIHSYVPQGGHS
jgi:carbonic anhydrase/acetyltransferase-like protein (isoleucine patch superfamily)